MIGWAELRAKSVSSRVSLKGPRRVRVTEGWSKAVVASARLGLGEAQSDGGETQTVCAPREVRGCCGELMRKYCIYILVDILGCYSRLLTA